MFGETVSIESAFRRTDIFVANELAATVSTKIEFLNWIEGRFGIED